ncbi:hypothetical protein MKX01_005747 [Papaver californicum]|nr:hypothetical protein MKX01_005747 [Papaver californicum]
MSSGGGGTLFSCPYKRCINGKGPLLLGKISFHLLKHEISSSYTMWRIHGDSEVKAQQVHRGNTSTESADTNVGYVDDDIEPIVDPFVDPVVDPSVNPTTDGVNENVAEGVDVNAGEKADENVGTSRSKRRQYLHKRAREPLYHSCPKGKQLH